MSRLSLYLNTVRHLRPVQVYRRLWFRWTRPRIDTTPRPPLRAVNGGWAAVAQRRASLVGPEAFRFLEVEGTLGEVGWDGGQRDKLWRYNQHYFDDLNSQGSAEREAWHLTLLARWVAGNAPGHGTGWEPYPTSLRIVNWIKWQRAGHALPEGCLQSIAVQARWLTGRIEWHLLGNHLFANAKALVFAGLLFDGVEAQRLLRKGLSLVARELSEQVLADGGHFERSPMYHALFLEDLLDLVNLSQAHAGAVDESVVAIWREHSVRMLAWLQAMCHPDGEIAFFNDAAIGIAPSPTEIAAYAERLGIVPTPATTSNGPVHLHHLPTSGHIRLVTGPAVALLDVAPIGPDYLPGHAHADTLSFELSLFGQRVLVNGGTSRYGSDALRLQERGTATHNTVEVDGHDSSEVWSGFRVARRARPLGLAMESDGMQACITCSHDGYRRLPGQALHTRQWLLTPGALRVQDRVSGGFRHAVARLHLHPQVTADPADVAIWLLRLANGQVLTLRVLEGEGQLEAGHHAPAFGRRVETQTLALHFGPRSQAAVEIRWGNDE
jgi:uncharacterized heparinase superfamily protein